MPDYTLSAPSTGELSQGIHYSGETEESLLADFEKQHNILTGKIIHIFSMPVESFFDRFNVVEGPFSKSVITKEPSEHEIARREVVAAGYEYFDKTWRNPRHPEMAVIFNNSKTEKLASILLEMASAHESDILKELQNGQKLRGVVASTISWGMIRGGRECIEATRENKMALLEELRMSREIREIVISLLSSPQPS